MSYKLLGLLFLSFLFLLLSILFFSFFSTHFISVLVRLLFSELYNMIHIGKKRTALVRVWSNEV